jgi:acetoin utilization protein AcuB
MDTLAKISINHQPAGVSSTGGLCRIASAFGKGTNGAENKPARRSPRMSGRPALKPVAATGRVKGGDSMFVRERMSSPAVTITPDTPLQDALPLMHEHRFRRLPVVDEKGRLVGIVSERDLLYASPPPSTLLSGLELNHLLAELQTREIMTQEVITTTPDTFVEDAARLMVENKIGGLPVVDEDNRVVGVITETDVFKAFIELYRAGHTGLYLMLKVRDGKGLLAELSKAVLGVGGDVVGISSSYDEASGDYRLVIKGEEIDRDRVVALLVSLGHQVIEVYEV